MIVSFFWSILSIGPSISGVLARSTPLAARCLTVRSMQSPRPPWPSGAQRLADLIDRGRLAEIVGDVGQVAMGTGEVAFEDVGAQELGVAGLDGIDEVVEMGRVVVELNHQLAGGIEAGILARVGIAPSAKLLNQFAVEIEGSPFGVAGQDDIALAAVEDRADLGAAERDRSPVRGPRTPASCRRTRRCPTSVLATSPASS